MLAKNEKKKWGKKKVKVFCQIFFYFLMSCWLTAAGTVPFEGQLIELNTWFNGRKKGSNPFVDYKRRNSDNIAATFPPGTTGNVTQVKKFPSGNFGIKVQLKSIPNISTRATGSNPQSHLGKEVWFFYNPNKNNLTLLDSQSAKTKNPEEAKTARTETIQPGLVTTNLGDQTPGKPDNTSVTTENLLQNSLKALESANSQIADSSKCEKCSVADAGLGSIQSCELQIGAAKIINRKINPEENVEQKYRLSRQSLTKFTVDLNLKFVQGSGYNSSSSASELNTIYKSKVNKCLEQINSTLKGPNNKSFEIKLSDDATIPSYNVTVDRFPVSESTGWDTNINCPEMVHEIMHLLGLTDEYSETRFGFTRNLGNLNASYGQSSSPKAYNCRHLGNPKSIMFNPTAAFEEALGVTEYKRISCFCTTNSKSCEQIHQKHRDSETCPNGQIRKEVTENGLGNSFPKSNPLLEPGELFLVYSKIKKQVKTPRESMLFPAQFRLITAPDCAKDNALYLECAKNAYKTSVEHGGDGCDSSVPATCKQGGALWLN